MLDYKITNRRAFCCGKTYQVFYPPRTTHSDTFWLDWLKNVSHYNRQGQDGQTLVMCIQPALSRGESSMLNTSELPNDAVGCLLWQVLDREVSPRYSLSAKACAGILRRAKARKKTLPPTLKVALERISDPQWGVVTASGGALGGGSETLVVHGTQDPIISYTTAHCLGRNGGRENILFDIAHRSDVVRIQDDDTTPTLTARMGTGGNNIPCIALAGNTIGRQPHNGGNGNGFDDSGVSYTLTTTDIHGVFNGLTVRKLTPSECEKLQGFPPGYTQIPYRNKLANDCPDSPRYKAIGNSMAVPVIKWIGERFINYLNSEIV